jgi:hypothetical protein
VTRCKSSDMLPHLLARCIMNMYSLHIRLLQMRARCVIIFSSGRRCQSNKRSTQSIHQPVCAKKLQDQSLTSRKNFDFRGSGSSYLATCKLFICMRESQSLLARILLSESHHSITVAKEMRIGCDCELSRRVASIISLRRLAKRVT